MITERSDVQADAPLSPPLIGHHALVTGANRGIGAAIANTLSGAGARVSLLVRDSATAQTTADSLAGPYEIVVADVTNQSAVELACATAARAFGDVDILVNNAGSAESAPFMKSDAAMFQRMFAVHVLAAVYTSQAVVPAMIARRRGHIVNVSSVAGLLGAPYIAAYTAAKHALVGVTRSLAAEVARPWCSGKCGMPGIHRNRPGATRGGTHCSQDRPKC